MSRTLKEIYKEALRERDKRMELNEYVSDSKMSVINGLLWVVSTIIYGFEALLDVFALDISETINKRINGTPAYYANALLQYQQGDQLSVREDGLAFGYDTIDTSKRIIKHVAYTESGSEDSLDYKLIYKVATGVSGDYKPVSPEEMINVNAYLRKIRFAGTRIVATSREGDILVPKLTVYYDGSVMEDELYDIIEGKIISFMEKLDYDSSVYVSRLVDEIRSDGHITDVYIDPAPEQGQGVFIVGYDDNGNLMPPAKVERVGFTASGYLKQSSCKGKEKDIPNFRQSVKIALDRKDEI